MISGLLFINEKGDIVISRFYKDDVSRQAADAFRLKVIRAKNLGAPVQIIDNVSFMYVRHGDIYVVAVSRKNANPALAFSFIYQAIDVFKAYFGGKFSEEHIRNHFVVVYELLDEIMDHGYPQILAANNLQQIIQVGSIKIDPKKLRESKKTITSEITGAVDWRTPGKYKYRKNEVFIDILESVNLLLSSKGNVLKSDVSGVAKMKTYLSGMPECKFGLNDKLYMDQESNKRGAAGQRRRHVTGIAIDDITFHRCVRLGKFDADRTISFVPPDGEFEVMKYRITQNINLPFSVIPVISEHGRSRVQFEIKIKANFSSKLFATNVVMRIPTPTNTSKTNFTTNVGKTKYDPQQNAIIWKIRKFPGQSSFILKGEVKLMALIKDKVWSRPPIKMDFQVPMYTSSGLHVRFLKVFEKSNYETIKWVRYITKAGSYEIRI